MEEEILRSIDTKLDAMIRLLASGIIQGKSKTDSIVALGDLGLDTNLIAKIVKTTPGTVYARLSEARRKGKTEGKKIMREAG